MKLQPATKTLAMRFDFNEEFPTLQSKQISSDLTQQHTVSKSGKTRTTGTLSNDDDRSPEGRRVLRRRTHRTPHLHTKTTFTPKWKPCDN